MFVIMTSICLATCPRNQRSLGNRQVCDWLALASLCMMNRTSLREVGYSNITEQ